MARTWAEMDAGQRRSMGSLQRDDVPLSAGIYAIYCDGERMYLGKAASLRHRVWGNHSGRGMSLGSSALRRNVAEYLGFGSSADIKAGRVQPSADDVAAVRAWLDGCEIAWLECADDAGAKASEKALMKDHRPPLSKR